MTQNTQKGLELTIKSIEYPDITLVRFLKSHDNRPLGLDFEDSTGQAKIQLRYVPSFIDIFSREKEGSFYITMDGIKYHFAGVFTHVEEEKSLVYLRDICADMARYYFIQLNQYHSDEQVSDAFHRILRIYDDRPQSNHTDMYLFHALALFASPTHLKHHCRLAHDETHEALFIKDISAVDLEFKTIADTQNVANDIYTFISDPDIRTTLECLSLANDKRIISENIEYALLYQFSKLAEFYVQRRDGITVVGGRKISSFLDDGITTPFYAQHPVCTGDRAASPYRISATKEAYTKATQTDATKIISTLLNKYTREYKYHIWKRAKLVETLLKDSGNWNDIGEPLLTR